MPEDDVLAEVTQWIGDAVLATFPERTSMLTIRSSLGEEVWAYVVRCDYRTELHRGGMRFSLTIAGAAGRWEFRSFAVDESGRPT